MSSATPTTTTTTGSAGKKAAEVINFRDFAHEYVDVLARSDQQYHLRDDIPVEVMVAGFELQEIIADLGRLGKVDKDESRGIIGHANERTTVILADIFRHTYPDVSDEEMATEFSLEERLHLIQLFFTRRSAQWRERAGAINDASAAVSSTTTTTTTTASREQRRSVSSRQGATPRRTR